VWTFDAWLSLSRDASERVVVSIGCLRPTTCLVLSVAIFVAQVAVSSWWLRRYRFGPAEWVWRTLTYGKLQPI
jgi:uncharacterized protein